MNIRFRFTSSLMVVFFATAHGQYLSPYQSPPGIEWKVIRTEHFDLVFPNEIARDAQRVASTLEHVIGPVSKTLKRTPTRFTLLLSNRTTVSNGYVRLAPRYSEWFCTPPPFSLLGTGEWFNLLASHETRHLVQLDRLRSGFTGIASLLFGESAWAFLVNWSVPSWVLEGDATGIETALSSSGRGRMPDFERELRTLEMTGERYSYEKAYLGSFADGNIDVYSLGYLLTTYLKRKYGADSFERILRTSTRWSFLPWAFSIAAYAETGETVREIYENTLDELHSLWAAQGERLHPTEGQPLKHDSRSCWTNYRYPRYLSDTSLVALKWGMADISGFVRLSRREKERPIRLAALYDEPFDASGSKIVWHERVPDSRWGKSDATVIRLLDVETGRERTVVSGVKYFSPAISPDGRRIAAVEFTADRSCALVLLDAETGAVVKRLGCCRDFYQTPRWTPDGRALVAVRHAANRGKGVALFDTSGAPLRDLIPPGREDVSLPVMHGRYLVYGSPYSGIDNIYVLDTITGRRLQATCSRYGAYHPAVSPDGKALAYADYTPDGFDVVEIPFEPSSWKPLEEVEERGVRWYDPLVGQESGGDVFVSIPERVYEVRDYSAIGHLLNVHSWTLLPGGDEHTFGGVVLSTNVMNTFSVDAGFEFNTREKNGALFADVCYAGLFPMFAAGGVYGMRTSTYTDENGAPRSYTWNERSARLGIRLPLNFSSGLFERHMTLDMDIARTLVSRKTVPLAGEINDGAFTPVTLRLNYAAGYGWIRDFRPRWGQVFTAVFRHTPLASDDYHATLGAVEGHVFIPGLFDAHNLHLGAGFQRHTVSAYRFPLEIMYPRGYEPRFRETLWSACIEYAFPLWYPDFHLWSLLNVQRVRVNVFHDIGEGRNGSRGSLDRSMGFELTSDFNLFDVRALLNAGVRGVYLIREKVWKWGFVFAL
ncbi:MAG: hypothetical protein QHI48_05215 [Bacteroidota bacterium]|nr:hypothetical protein [Bacteroidota bacterium]